MIERIYWVISSQRKCRKCFLRNLRRLWATAKICWMNTLHKKWSFPLKTSFFVLWHGDFFLWTHLHQACFVSNVLEKVVDLTTLNILRTTRVMLMNFCLINTPRCQILIWLCKVLCLFQQLFTCEKAKGYVIKRQKIPALKLFLLPRYFKKWTA